MKRFHHEIKADGYNTVIGTSTARNAKEAARIALRDFFDLNDIHQTVDDEAIRYYAPKIRPERQNHKVTS